MLSFMMLTRTHQLLICLFRFLFLTKLSVRSYPLSLLTGMSDLNSFLGVSGKHGVHKIRVGHLFFMNEYLVGSSTVPCPLLVVDISPDIYHDFSSFDVIHNDLPSSSLSRHESHEAPFPSSPIPVEEPEIQVQLSSSSARIILQDMFLSRPVTGIRASVFHCPLDHLRKVCSLHGLDVSPSSTTRDVRLHLLYHIINSDCFAQCCEPCRPSPDHSACLCVAP